MEPIDPKKRRIVRRPASDHMGVRSIDEKIEEQLTLLKSQQKPQSTKHHPNIGFDTAKPPSAFTSNPPQQPTESPFVESHRASPTHRSDVGEKSIPPDHNQSTSENRSAGYDCSASRDEDGDPVHDVEHVHVAGEEVVSKDVRRSIVTVGKRRVTRSAAMKSPFVCSIQAKTMIPNLLLKNYVKRLNDASIQSDEIVCAMVNFHLTKAELLSLMPKHWVNNMVIQMFCAVFNERVDSMGHKSRKIYISPTQSGGIISQRLSLELRKQIRTVCNPILRDFPLTDLSVVEMLFFPINQGNHWFVIILNIQDGRCDILDYRSGNRNFPRQTQLLKNLGRLRTMVNSVYGFMGREDDIST